MNRSIRVLVADDEKNLRDLVVRELSRRGLEVEGVGDGEAALASLAAADVCETHANGASFDRMSSPSTPR